MSINGTLAFVILWIVNALIALVYLLVGIFLYVPACDLKREQGEEIQYDNRRAFFIRFIVMVLCPVVGPAFFLCSYLIYKTVFRQAVDLEDVIFSKERVQTHLKADEERERNMAPLEESLAVSDKRNMRMLMLNVIRGDMQKSLESITMALNSEDSETSHYAASVLRDELNDFRSNVQKMYTQMQQETETETECEEMLIDYMNRILSQKIFTTMEQTKYVNMLEEAAESLYQKNGARITADRYEGLCLKLLDLKKIPETEKWCMRLARQHGNALAAYTCRLKLYFTMGEKEKFFEVLQELKESDIIIDNETLELIRIQYMGALGAVASDRLDNGLGDLEKSIRNLDDELELYLHQFTWRRKRFSPRSARRLLMRLKDATSELTVLARLRREPGLEQFYTSHLEYANSQSRRLEKLYRRINGRMTREDFS